MFEFFFKYPSSLFSKGKLVLLAGWPVWLLALFAIAGVAALAWVIFRNSTQWGRARAAVIWALQAATVCTLLLMLWQPAISVSTLKEQQNIVAVLVDDSRSMSLSDSGVTRKDAAAKVLNDGLIDGLKKRFQVRLYKLSAGAQRIQGLEGVTAQASATHIGDAIKQVTDEAGSLPIGAVVLLSDGGDNAGGVDLETMNEIRSRHIPVHAIGFGAEKLEKDLEVTSVETPMRALADSRLTAQISFKQRGFAGQKARLVVRENGKTLATQDTVIKADGMQQTETLVFNAGVAGTRVLQASVEPLAGETNAKNNAVTRLIQVDSSKPRILYIEGEPKWEFKFIRRAMEEDRSVELVTMLRTTQNKIYRQGVKDSKELEDGFPVKVDELFGFQGLIVGGVEAGYFNAAQQELIKLFVDRRGGGLLMLGGRAGLAEGGYAQTPLAEVLPLTLPDRKGTFVRDPAYVSLTKFGRDSLICRLVENLDKNEERWKKLPYLANFQDPGIPKPGATVLADMKVGNQTMPFLTTQNYGRGRTAVIASAGTWRWQMTQPVEDKTHEMFWQQMLRWLVQATPGQVVASTPKTVLSDETKMQLRAEVRDKNFMPTADADVEARVMGPGGAGSIVPMAPDPLTAGLYTASWNADKAGSYVVEVMVKRAGQELGRDVVTFLREDGVAENFRAEQNRELLERLASDTGGKYYRPEDAKHLPVEIAYSEAGISAKETKDLWNMPVFFLLLIALRTVEWLLRRKWGTV